MSYPGLLKLRFACDRGGARRAPPLSQANLFFCVDGSFYMPTVTFCLFPMHEYVTLTTQIALSCLSGRSRSVLRKDRVLEALRSLCAQRPAQSGVLRRHAGFSAEDVAVQAQVDRTNASRDLNLLVQEGMVERIPGRPVLFVVKTPPVGAGLTNEGNENGSRRGV